VNGATIAQPDSRLEVVADTFKVVALGGATKAVLVPKAVVATAVIPGWYTSHRALSRPMPPLVVAL